MSEQYYAEMEAARNEAEDAYFKARPQLWGTAAERSIFRAGFERGFEKLVEATRCAQGKSSDGG